MMAPHGSVLFLFCFTTSRGQGWYQISSHFIVTSVPLCLLYVISYFLYPVASGLSDLNPIKIWIGQVLTVDVSLSSLSFRGFSFSLSVTLTHSNTHTHTHKHTHTHTEWIGIMAEPPINPFADRSLRWLQLIFSTGTGIFEYYCNYVR